ncbi:hypothetical protein PGT21_007472 [Puccinia graminis f. sp. tritici]|uniref:Uncharacterized protein n=1 Tax=Puccinia graminis f. sp. tritici TaxID=56615 RepID=A0A5B0LPY6_PUCGR|nr:hypothetical protein PGTUg99_003335 [Puccinia graminis f. sp. tritici]KAA1065678.1 hypothetical protein PGT21_007472 [Puccinia graminis f. sp. tritici]
MQLHLTILLGFLIFQGIISSRGSARNGSSSKPGVGACEPCQISGKVIACCDPPSRV